MHTCLLTSAASASHPQLEPGQRLCDSEEAQRLGEWGQGRPEQRSTRAGEMRADVLGHQRREHRTTDPGRAEPLKPDRSGATSRFWCLLSAWLGQGINSLSLKFPPLHKQGRQRLLQGATVG